MHIPNLTQLKQALAIAEKIESLKTELASLVGDSSTNTATPASAPAGPARKSGKRTMSAAARARIGAAQRARWAKVKGTASAPTAKKAKARAKKGKLSAAHRAKLGAAAKARWARIKKGQERSPFAAK